MKKRLRKKLLKKDIERMEKRQYLIDKYTSLLYSMQTTECKVGNIIKLKTNIT